MAMKRCTAGFQARPSPLWSKPDEASLGGHFRFLPQSAHHELGSTCPLCARSRHWETMAYFAAVAAFSINAAILSEVKLQQAAKMLLPPRTWLGITVRFKHTGLCCTRL